MDWRHRPKWKVIDAAVEVQDDSDVAEALAEAQRAAQVRAQAAVKEAEAERETIKSAEARRDFEQQDSTEAAEHGGSGAVTLDGVASCTWPLLMLTRQTTLS